MDVSIGIMCYNEEKNISKLLDSLTRQKTKDVRIAEIIAVSSGSTDRTDKIVRNYRGVRLITEDKRMGKASAINKFLKASSSEILVLQSADTIPKEDAIENLCLPMNDPDVGIVGARPIPMNIRNNYLGYSVKVLWELHHNISLKRPKFGELIAFRNIFREIGNTAVDEEYIAMLIRDLGYRFYYSPNALVYNKGPETISDFIKQRRRIYCGHIKLKKKKKYEVPTLKNSMVLKEFIKGIKPRNALPSSFALILEGYARFLGMVDYHTKKDHTIWEVIKSSK